MSTKYIINADQIIQAADIEAIFRGIGADLHRSGSYWYTKCPNCGKDPAEKKGKGLCIVKKKGMSKCQSCGFSLCIVNKQGGTFFEKHPQFSLSKVEALEKLATFTHVIPEYRENTKPEKVNTWVKIVEDTTDLPPAEPQNESGGDNPPTPPPSGKKAAVAAKKSFVQEQLEASGLTWDDVTVTVNIDGTTKKSFRRYSQGTRDAAGNINTDGPDMQLHYVTLNRELLMYQKLNTRGEPYGKQIPYTRQRNFNPEDHKDKYGKPMKYRSPYGTGVQPWHTNLLLAKYERRAEVDTLYIVEGEKKADCMAKFGMVTVGIGGITMLANNDTLHPDFAQIVSQLKVKNVVFVTDGDWDLIKAGPDEPVNVRPAQFRSAVMNFERYFRELSNIGLNVRRYWGYVKHIDGKPEVKGVDDLVVKHLEMNGQQLREDFDKAMLTKSGHGTNVNCIEISEWPPAKFNEYLGVDSIESFFQKYKDQLKNREKIMYGRTEYRYMQETGEFECAYPIEESERFWTQEQGKNKETYTMLYHKFDQFAANRGIGSLVVDEKNPLETQWVHADSKTKTVRHIHGKYIRDYVRDVLHEMREYGISNFIRNMGKLKDERLEQLPPLDNQIKLLKHQRHVSYMYFRDRTWIINDNEVLERQPHEIEGYRWESDIIDRSPAMAPEPMFEITPNEDGTWKLYLTDTGLKSQFLLYLFNTGRPHGKDLRELSEVDKNDVVQHFVNKLTALGYLMRNWKNPALAKAIFLMDMFRDGQEEDQASGRSGKSLFAHALTYLRPVLQMDGKAPGFDDDKFLFGRITRLTRIVVVDDLQKGANLKRFYNAWVSDIVVRALHQQEYVIPREISPYWVYTLNYDIPGLYENDSTADRIHILAFNNWYNKDYRPSDEFGNLLFDEWDEEQWSLFYQFAAECTRAFMKYGLVSAPESAVKQKQLFHAIHPTVRSWADEYFLGDLRADGTYTYQKFLYSGNAPSLYMHEKKNLFNSFMDYAQKGNKRFTMNERKFKEYLRLWAEFNGFIFNPGKKWSKASVEMPNGGQWISNSIEYIVLGLNPKQEEETLKHQQF